MTRQQPVASAIRSVLADSTNLYLKTHGYHWNVEGPAFHTLHALFEEHYRDIWGALDELAERLRALGFYAPMGIAALSGGSKIEVADNAVPDADTMIANLVAGHETLIGTAKEALKIAQDAADPATEGLLSDRIVAHEKMAWMLRASRQT